MLTMLSTTSDFSGSGHVPVSAPNSEPAPSRHMRRYKGRLSLVPPPALPADTDVNPALALCGEEGALELTLSGDRPHPMSVSEQTSGSGDEGANCTSSTALKKSLNISISAIETKSCDADTVKCGSANVSSLKSFWEKKSSHADNVSRCESPETSVNLPCDSISTPYGLNTSVRDLAKLFNGKDSSANASLSSAKKIRLSSSKNASLASPFTATPVTRPLRKSASKKPARFILDAVTMLEPKSKSPGWQGSPVFGISCKQKFADNELDVSADSLFLTPPSTGGKRKRSSNRRLLSLNPSQYGHSRESPFKRVVANRSNSLNFEQSDASDISDISTSQVNEANGQDSFWGTDSPRADSDSPFHDISAVQPVRNLADNLEVSDTSIFLPNQTADDSLLVSRQLALVITPDVHKASPNMSGFNDSIDISVNDSINCSLLPEVKGAVHDIVGNFFLDTSKRNTPDTKPETKPCETYTPSDVCDSEPCMTSKPRQVAADHEYQEGTREADNPDEAGVSALDESFHLSLLSETESETDPNDIVNIDLTVGDVDKSTSETNDVATIASETKGVSPNSVKTAVMFKLGLIPSAPIQIPLSCLDIPSPMKNVPVAVDTVSVEYEPSDDILELTKPLHSPCDIDLTKPLHSPCDLDLTKPLHSPCDLDLTKPLHSPCDIDLTKPLHSPCDLDLTKPLHSPCDLDPTETLYIPCDLDPTETLYSPCDKTVDTRNCVKSQVTQDSCDEFDPCFSPQNQCYETLSPSGIDCTPLHLSFQTPSPDSDRIKLLVKRGRKLTFDSDDDDEEPSPKVAKTHLGECGDIEHCGSQNVNVTESANGVDNDTDTRDNVVEYTVIIDEPVSDLESDPVPSDEAPLSSDLESLALSEMESDFLSDAINSSVTDYDLTDLTDYDSSMSDYSLDLSDEVFLPGTLPTKTQFPVVYQPMAADINANIYQPVLPITHRYSFYQRPSANEEYSPYSSVDSSPSYYSDETTFTASESDNCYNQCMDSCVQYTGNNVSELTGNLVVQQHTEPMVVPGSYQNRSDIFHAPHVAVLERDSSVCWKEYGMGTVTYTYNPSPRATMYANECYNSAVFNNPAGPDFFATRLDYSAPLQSQPSTSVPAASHTDYSGYRSDTVTVNKPVDVAVSVNSAVFHQPPSPSSSSFDSEGYTAESDSEVSSDPDAILMMEKRVRTRLRRKLKANWSKLSQSGQQEGNLLDSLKDVHPYAISGWVSSTYLLALSRKTDLINEMFHDSIDEDTGAIRDWIVNNCRRTSASTLAVDLLFRLFTLGEVHQCGLNELSHERRYRAIKACVFQHFPRGERITMWRNCTVKMKAAITSLFKYRVPMVQNFLVLHTGL